VLPVQIAAEVKGFDPRRTSIKTAGRLERFSSSPRRRPGAGDGLTVTEDNAERIGVVMNTGGGGVGLVEREARCCGTGPRRVSPLFSYDDAQHRRVPIPIRWPARAAIRPYLCGRAASTMRCG
jgi:hypothetical protein